MSRKWKIVLGIVAVSTVVLVTWPVYAHCGKCASSGKDMVKMMEEGKLGLSKAVEIAEKHSKGKAMSVLAARIGRTVYFMLQRRQPFNETQFVKV